MQVIHLKPVGNDKSGQGCAYKQELWDCKRKSLIERVTTDFGIKEKSMIYIETERLILRNAAAKDAAVMFDYRNNEICAKYQRGQTKEYDGICDLIERRKNDKLSVDAPFMLAVALKHTDEMIGEIVVMPEDGTISLGYTFHYQYHRQGYAFEALTTLINLLHESYPLWDFISFTDPENKPSMALLTKLGYKNMGYMPSMESQVFGKWTTPATDAEIAQAVNSGE